MSQVIRRDPETLRRALLPWLHERLPEADAIELPLPRKPGSGGSSETLLISPTIRQAGVTRREEWVLRIEPSDHQIYMDPGLRRQFLVMQALHAQGDVPVPAMLWYEADPTTLGVPFFVMEHVHGQVMPGMHHSGGFLAEAPPAAREAIWLSAIETMARLHRLSEARFQFLARPALGSTGLDQEIAYWTDYLAWSGAPVRAEQERALRWMADNLPDARGGGLAWGDARPANMIFRDDKCRAVIDWETTSLGGAETDLGWWLFFDWNVSEGSKIARLEGTTDRAGTIAAWEHFAGRRAEAMEWHEAFAALRFSMIVDRARLLAERMGRPETVPADAGHRIAERLVELTA
ncbi:phosphotransferase family protein [Sphingomonas solaris]|nr:phosphotransferase family protein [Sphingomonas solaris]